MPADVLHFKKKPFSILLLIGLILVLTSFLFNQGNTTVDIHIHDTYFIVSGAYVFWLPAFVSLIVWILYLLTYKRLYSPTLSWIHIIITGLTIVLLPSTLFLNNGIIRQNFDNPLNAHYDWTTAIAITITVLIFSQAILVINLLLGLFTRRN